MRPKFRFLLILTLLMGTPVLMNAQEGVSRKQFEKNEARQAKEDAKAKKSKEKEDRKRHLAIQDKDTRKRLKRHQRRAERGGIGAHRDRFPGRLFNRKR